MATHAGLALLCQRCMVGRCRLGRQARPPLRRCMRCFRAAILLLPAFLGPLSQARPSSSLYHSATTSNH